MNSLEIKCQEIYEQQGQDAVYRYIIENEPQVQWLECEPCEIVSPISNSACLVCASEVR